MTVSFDNAQGILEFRDGMIPPTCKACALPIERSLAAALAFQWGILLAHPQI